MAIRYTGARVALTLACVSGFIALAPRAEAQTTITVNDTTQGLTASCTIANAINTANAVTSSVVANISSIEREISAANAVLQTDQDTLNKANQYLQTLGLQVTSDDSVVEQLQVQLATLQPDTAQWTQVNGQLSAAETVDQRDTSAFFEEQQVVDTDSTNVGEDQELVGEYRNNLRNVQTSVLVGGCTFSAGDGTPPFTLVLANSTYPMSVADNYWYGPNALPPIASQIIIQGNGATLEVVPGTTRLRFFYVGADPNATATLGFNTPGAGDLTLQNLTLTGGVQQGGSSVYGGGGAGMGGAIFNQGVLNLSSVTASGNSATGGSTNGGLSFALGGGGLGSDSDSPNGAGFGGPVIPAGSAGAGSDGGGFSLSGTADGLGGAGGDGGGGGGGGSGGGGGGQSGAVGGAFGGGGQEGGSGGGVGGGGGGNAGGEVGSGGGGGGGFGGGGGGDVGGGGGGGFGGGGGDPNGVGGFGGGAGGEGRGAGAGGGLGGAIFNHGGVLTVLNSTLTGNSATGGTTNGGAGGGSGFGGAIFNLNGSVAVNFSTLAGNTVTAGAAVSPGTAGAALGGAIYSLGYNLQSGQIAKLGLTDSVFANSNSALGSPSTVPDVVVDAPATVASGATNVATSGVVYVLANLIENAAVINNATGGALFNAPVLTSDPGLAALSNNNAGLTQTLAIGASSPAYLAGVCAPTITTVDQNGTPRPQGSSCTLGAFEFVPDTVPNVVGESLTDASNAITGAGLGVGTVTQQSSSIVAAGVVISQSPVGATVIDQGAPVNLVVSSGPPQVAVPNVLGDTQDVATSALTGAGLSLGSVTSASSPTLAVGLVLSESPGVGTAVNVGSAVNLVLSSGPAEVAVPNVIGDTQDVATTTLTGAGLSLGTVTQQSSATVPSGEVISTSPAGGTEVNLSSTVNLVVSTGPAQVAVPNVVGETQTAATSTVTGAGLVLGTVTPQASATIPAGQVISESPAASTNVNLGSVVSLVVSSGPTEPVSVDLTNVMTLYAFSEIGTKPIAGGLDGASNAYTALETADAGASLDWSGATFALQGAGVPSAVANATIALPQNSYSALEILATGVNGGARQQKLSVNYTDNSQDTFVQSFSDWKHPESYVGEAIANSAPNRVIGNGKTQAGVTNLYGYAFPVNPAKTVESLTLPPTKNVALLALDLTPALSAVATTASPTFSPQPGAYGAATPVTLASTTPNAIIYYTTNGTTPTTSSTLYTGPIEVTITTTLEAIAVSHGEQNSTIASGTYTIATTGATPVSLATDVTLYAIAEEDAPALDGGIDGHGNAYPGNVTGTNPTWAGNPYVLGQIGTPSAVSSTTIALPPGQYTGISLLATAVNGSQVQTSKVSTTFTVNYQDGTSQTFVQSMSDWHAPNGYPGEQIALTMPYKVLPSGALQVGKYDLYGYAFPLNPAETAVSLTLPKNRNIVVLAVDVEP